MFGGLARLLGRGIEEVLGQGKGAQPAKRDPQSAPQPIQGKQFNIGQPLPYLYGGKPQTDMTVQAPWTPQNNQPRLDQYTRNNINESIGGFGVGSQELPSQMGWSDNQLHNPWGVSPDMVSPILNQQTKKTIRRNFLDY